MTKKFKYSLIALIVLMLVTIPIGTLAANDYHVVVNGQEIDFKQPVVFQGSRALVPMNTVFELLDAKITYDKTKQTILVENDYTTVEMYLNSEKALVHRKHDFSGIPLDVSLDAVPCIANNTVYIPLRFVAESLGARVDWDSESHTAFISTGFDIIPVETPADYTVIKYSDLKDQKVLAWYESVNQIKGVCSLVVDGDTYVYIGAGQKSSGGYELNLESATEVRPGSLYVTARLSKPAPDADVITVLTYPSVLIKFENQTFDIIDGEIIE